MSKSLARVRILAKECYLFVGDLKASNFKRDGHEVTKVKVRVYRTKAKTNPSPRKPFPYVKGLRSNGSRKNDVGRADIEIGIFNVDCQSKVNKIYSMVMERHGDDMKIGCEKPWNGVIVPFVISTLYTRNIKTGDTCRWKTDTISDSNKEQAMMLVSVNRVNVEKLKDIDIATRAAGKMMEDTCTMFPKLGPLRCVKS